MLMQPTTIAAAQAAGSPYFWDNGQKKLAVTAEQLAQFQSGGQYDPTGGSALTQWANLNTKPRQELYPVGPPYDSSQPRQELYPVGPPPDQPKPGLYDRLNIRLGELYDRGNERLGELYDRGNIRLGEAYDKGNEWLGGVLSPTTESGIGVPRRLERPVRKGRVAPVSYSQVAMDKIADWEGGYQDKPFDDVGTQRIGFGREYAKGEKTTEAKERGWLMGKVQDIGDWLDGVVTADLNANQKAALTSLVYNVGKGSFKKSKALKALNAGDMDEFRSQAFSKNKGWVKSKGKFMKGLYNRRMKEQALFDG
tara:strand:- start:209 stop:1135 length:927 start_codon:yes stop_codon:yes gene_type:complete